MSNAQILVVEDDGIVALGLRTRLQNLGYQVLGMIPYGEEAVERAAEVQPDLVLMDIRLKGKIDGIEAAQKIREHSNIPVIYLTAYADDQTLERAKQTQPYGYILKPIEERELRTTIEMALYKHQMEQKLKEHEQWLTTVLKSIADAVIAVDGTGRITFMNPVAEMLTGWSEQEALGRELTEVFAVFHEESRKPVAENPVKKTLRTGRSATQGERIILSARNGRQLPIEDNTAPIRDEKGNVTGAVLVFRDITERRQAESALEQYTAELRARNEDLDAFGYSVAHDLKNLVSQITGFAEASRQHYEKLSPEEKKDDLQAILRSGRKMANVIDELLLLAGVRQQKIEIQSLNMDAVFQEARQRLAHLVEKRQAEITFPDTWPAALGYGPWIEEVWVNYLSNAINYGGQPPRVEVGAASQPDGMVRFWVRDNGSGLTPEEQARLFLPFTRLNQVSVNGHGLGLSIVRRIVTKLGGTVGVASEGTPGRGSTFSFALPAAGDEQRPGV